MKEFVLYFFVGVGFVTVLLCTVIGVGLFCDWVKKVIEDEIRRRVK
jgi:hypothetical protein